LRFARPLPRSRQGKFRETAFYRRLLSAHYHRGLTLSGKGCEISAILKAKIS